jgi:hypothetical protein
VDDDRLAQLLHDAVQESPPATFDADDVLTESRRLTARRRSLVRNTTVGAVILVAAGLLTGLGVVGLGSFGHTVSSSAGSAAAAGSSDNPGGLNNEFHPNSHAKSGPEAQFNVPASPSMQGDGDTGSAGHPTGSTPGGCGSTDGELAVALAGELPSVGDPHTAAVPGADCPSGTTFAAAVSVVDNGATGVVIALVRPATAAAVPASAGVGHASSPSTQHNTVITVLSQPQATGGPIPFQAQLPAIAQRLAARF